MSWKAADFHDLDGDGLEPGEQPMQSCLILERAVYHRLDRLDRGGEPVEVKEHLGRENTGYADLVTGQRHHAPSRSEFMARSLGSVSPFRAAPLVAG